MITILFLASNPIDTSSLRLDEEIRAIDQWIQRSKNGNLFEIKQAWAVRVADLQEALLRYKPDIVHFSGHGSNTNEIIFMDDSGTKQPVSNASFTNLLFTLRDKIRCVVLNACYSEQQANEIAQNIDCVIGMKKTITDQSSIKFAAAFYQALAYGMNVKVAFDLGCNQIDLEGLGEQDVPKLLSPKCVPNDVYFLGSSKEDPLKSANELIEKFLLSSLINRALPSPRTRETESEPKKPPAKTEPKKPSTNEIDGTDEIEKIVYCSTCGILAGSSSQCKRTYGGHNFVSIRKDIVVFCRHCGLVPGKTIEECTNKYSGHSFLAAESGLKVYCKKCGISPSEKPIKCLDEYSEHSFFAAEKSLKVYCSECGTSPGEKPSKCLNDREHKFKAY